MNPRKMVSAEVVHGGGWIEKIVTDDPKLLGEWLIYTAHQLPDYERQLVGNWIIKGWTLKVS